MTGLSSENLPSGGNFSKIYLNFFCPGRSSPLITGLPDKSFPFLSKLFQLSSPSLLTMKSRRPGERSGPFDGCRGVSGGAVRYPSRRELQAPPDLTFGCTTPFAPTATTAETGRQCRIILAAPGAPYRGCSGTLPRAAGAQTENKKNISVKRLNLKAKEIVKNKEKIYS